MGHFKAANTQHYLISHQHACMVTAQNSTESSADFHVILLYVTHLLRLSFKQNLPYLSLFCKALQISHTSQHRKCAKVHTAWTSHHLRMRRKQAHAVHTVDSLPVDSVCRDCLRSPCNVYHLKVILFLSDLVLNISDISVSIEIEI